ncbi:MarR family transcriptional regulator [Nocardia noduli]|uniref:MarR family transcriptional regulator n=1 Tax=Nocardia noduli TaxID=2815722 RepID=UPI001C21FB66|nr:helix-turn-helix domain-containing protein [Nocardia noduli]
MPRIAARRSMRKYVAASGKYDTAGTLSYKTLPEVPAAVPIYATDRRTGLLAFDFDVRVAGKSPDDRAAAVAVVERDVDRLLGWLHDCGGVAVVDRATSSGMHVLVPLAEHERFSRSALMPLLELLKTLLVSFDPMPMLNPKKGCITPPGSRCKTGGFRQLVGMSVEDATAVFAARSAPGLVARLMAKLDPQRWLSTVYNDPDELAPRAAYEPAPTDEQGLTPSSTRSASVRAWVPRFLATGVAPDLTDRAGKPWTPSHARLSVLEQHAVRGWTLSQIKATTTDPKWAGFWNAYAHRADRKHRLSTDWQRAYAHAKRRLERTRQQSSQLVHKPLREHTGGVRGIRWKLAAARKWILLSGHFTGQELWTALATVTAVAYGISLTGRGSVANGGRWLSVAGGLIGRGSLLKVLRKFRQLQHEGGPIQFVASWNAREHSGDRYRLVTPRLDGRQVRAAEWEAFAARPEAIDPVWSELGYAAWWTYEILSAIEPGPGQTVRPEELAAAARISLSTVHRALRRLQDALLVDRAYGSVARTGRTPRRIPQLSNDADDRRAARLARDTSERTQFWQFVDLINANFTTRELRGYATITELDTDTTDYNRAVDQSPPPPRPDHEPSHPTYDHDIDDPEPAEGEPESAITDDDQALALLQDLLGATVIEPPDPPPPRKACVSGGVP